MTSMSGAHDQRSGGTTAGPTAGPWLDRLNGWRERRALRRALARMDAHLWADLGFDEAAAREEMGKPFWRR
ncbi:DUF1127 domain-containing protein [Azospirillum sp. YIM DDC1]|uniref:DUF1127 domain-containing protein n=1 Tax=Azospirillum aestuarii TaxID=2802052 RepID=A0ABS1I144_9PROT|nr:DUF1127 domain-containing protein [Azospirillum aestuarii]MBK4720785.1 DUF1127 domain-containing protein [Azospirillum aestuarii]TWA85359.1 uncharacterized protein DUF1127 [Azospirillum brasilense]